MTTVQDESGIRYCWWSGATLMTAGDSLPEAIHRACQWAPSAKQRPRVTIHRIAPDSRHAITPPWPGGTWGGSCGSTAWLHDPPFTLQQDRAGDEAVRRSQAWWINGRSREAWRGFRVECQGRHHHEGPCRAAGISWRWAPSQADQLEPAGCYVERST